MAIRADFTLYSPGGRLAAVAEVKKKFRTSEQWATKLRQNLLAYESLSGADFFLLVTPDRLYVWKKKGKALKAVRPDFVVNAKTIFAPYFERAGINPDEVSGYAFELIVESWLTDLTRLEDSQQRSANGKAWLVESGLLAEIKDGRIVSEEAA